MKSWWEKSDCDRKTLQIEFNWQLVSRLVLWKETARIQLRWFEGHVTNLAKGGDERYRVNGERRRRIRVTKRKKMKIYLADGEHNKSRK